MREQVAIGRKLYRNSVRRENLGTAAIRRKLYRNPVRYRENRKWNGSASGSGAFFVQQKRKYGADNMSKNQTVTDRNGIIILSKEVGKPLIIK